MPYRLSEENVLAHLQQRHLWQDERSNSHIEPKLAKNFNLLVTSGHYSWLVKQEPRRSDGSCKGDLQHEWQLHQLLQQSGLAQLRPLISEMADFDSSCGIAVFRYRQDYRDLSEFYDETTSFPTAIPAALGRTLGQIHAATFNPELALLSVSKPDLEPNFEPNFEPDLTQDWGTLTPNRFAELSTAGLKFYQLYQRYDSLGRAVAALNNKLEPCCLTHNDLKLNNILLHHNWHQSSLDKGDAQRAAIVQVIDWEKWDWGDPAADLGGLVAAYLKLWLQSLLVTADMAIELSLRLAERPLEQLQPSLVALVSAYTEAFPAIIQRFPDFLERVIQCAGLALIESIQAGLHYYEPFGNQEICMLQVAKTLLCEPQAAGKTVFGRTDSLEDWPSGPSQSLEQQPSRRPIAGLNSVGDRSPEPNRIDCSFDLVPHRSTAEQIRDIAQHIQINSTSQISHRDYEPSQLPDSLKVQYQQIAVALQQQHLSIQLRNFLDRIYGNGAQQRCADVFTQAAPGLQELQNQLQNNQYRGIQLDFYSQLEQANRGSGYLDLGWRGLTGGPAGWLVQKQGLNLLVPTSEVPALVQMDQQIAVRLPKNRIDDRYYVAVGNTSEIRSTSPLRLNASASLQICFNLTDAGAVRAMNFFTAALNHSQIAFLLKARFDVREYDCWDTVLLELASTDYGKIQPLLQQFYQAEQAAFRSPIPLFIKPLAPGLGLAEQPADRPFRTHRYQLIADVLIDCCQRQITAPDAKIQAFQQAFRQQGLDWDRPYLNPGSRDRYQFDLLQNSTGYTNCGR